MYIWRLTYQLGCYGCCRQLRICGKHVYRRLLLKRMSFHRDKFLISISREKQIIQSDSWQLITQNWLSKILANWHEIHAEVHHQGVIQYSIAEKVHRSRVFEYRCVGMETFGLVLFQAEWQFSIYDVNSDC